MLIEQGEEDMRVDGVVRPSGWGPQLTPPVVVYINRVLCKEARKVVEGLVLAIERVVEEDRKLEQAMGEALPSASADTEPPTRIDSIELATPEDAKHFEQGSSSWVCKLCLGSDPMTEHGPGVCMIEHGPGVCMIEHGPGVCMIEHGPGVCASPSAKREAKWVGDALVGDGAQAAATLRRIAGGDGGADD